MLTKLNLKKQKKIEDNNTKNKKNDDLFNKGTLGLLDLICPDCVEENKDYLYLGPGKYLRIYAIFGYPHNMYIGYLNDFFSIGGIDISTYIENIPDDTVIKTLTRKFSIIMSNLELSLKKGNIVDHGQEKAAKDLDSLRAGVQTNTEKMFYTQPIVFIWGKDIEELNDKDAVFNNICSRKSIVEKCLVYNQMQGLVTGLPILRIKYNEAMRNMSTGAIACMIPTGNTGLQHPNGIYYGDNIFNNSRVFYDEFIGAPTLSNPHTFICGTSGAGKSVTLKLKAERSAASGCWGVILDPQEEYKKLITHLGGQYITLQPGVKSGINPFELEVVEDENGKKMVDLYGKRSEIIEMLSVFSEKFRNGKPLAGVEITAVDSTVERLYEDFGITENPDSLYKKQQIEKDGKFYTNKIKKDLPTLSDLREKLIEHNEKLGSRDLNEFIEVMKMITGNGPMSIFDCQTTITLNSRIIAFSFKHLTDEFSKFFAQVNTLTWIWSKFSNYKYKDIKKQVYVDEGRLFAKYKQSLNFIEDIARLGRKYHIALSIATQFIDDFLGDKSSEAIINLCATKIILKQESAVADKTAGFFHLSARCKKFIRTFAPGQAILLSEASEPVILNIKPFDYEWKYVTT